MLGAYDFCGHYEWTFGWAERTGGAPLVRGLWRDAIAHDSQAPLIELFRTEGFNGMRRYWAHTLTEESPALGFNITETPATFRFDMHDCPSKGFLLRNGLENYHDYCDHCMGWIGPVMAAAGFVVDHEHNHCGQCWWEMRRPDTAPSMAALGAVGGASDVRLRPDWRAAARVDHYEAATDPDAKSPLDQR